MHLSKPSPPLTSFHFLKLKIEIITMDSGFGIGGHSKSVVEMTTSKLDYWSPFIVENSVKRSYKIEIRPQSISGDGPIEFHLSPDPEKFIDISALTLHGRVGVRVKGADGKWVPVSKDTPKPENWGVINNFYQSLCSSVTAKVNDCEIGDIANNSYPYASYLQTLLGTSASQAANHILSERGFIKDIAGEYYVGQVTADMCTQTDGPFYLRRKSLIEKEFVDFNIPLHNDLMTVEKFLPPNTKLSFTIRKSSDDFLIWKANTDTNEYKIVMEDLHLKVMLLEVFPQVLSNHQKLLKESGGLKMKYTQNVLKTFAVPKGSVELKQHNLFFGKRLPDRVYITFVEQDAYNGNDKKNPFYFETVGMKEAALIVNGVSEPSPPYSFEEGVDEKDLYFSFLENTGTSSFEMDSVNVSFNEFKNGYFILPFDRSPTKDNGLYTHKTEGGSLTVKVKSKKPLEKNYMVMVYGSYDSSMVFIDDKVLTEEIY